MSYGMLVAIVLIWTAGIFAVMNPVYLPAKFRRRSTAVTASGKFKPGHLAMFAILLISTVALLPFWPWARPGYSLVAVTATLTLLTGMALFGDRP